MDPIAHTFTGMALAAAGLRRATPLAATALVMGVNASDVDVLASFGPEFEQLAFRRGWTHGVLALVLWPFVLTGVLLAWDRHVRLKRKPDAAPARAGPLLALTALARARGGGSAVLQCGDTCAIRRGRAVNWTAPYPRMRA